MKATIGFLVILAVFSGCASRRTGTSPCEAYCKQMKRHCGGFTTDENGGYIYECVKKKKDKKGKS